MKSSPIDRVQDIHEPILLMADVKDQITAGQQSHDFENAAIAAGKDIQTDYFENAGHVASHWRDELPR